MVFSIIGLLSLSSCDSVNEAQLVSDSFFTAYNNEDQAVMDTLFDKELIVDAGMKDDFYKVFDQHWKTFGKITSHSRYSFLTKTNNGLSTVELSYNCETEKGSDVYEKLIFVKRVEGYKIISYEYNVDKSEIEKDED